MGEGLQKERDLCAFQQEPQAGCERLVVPRFLSRTFTVSLGAHLLQVLLYRLLQGFEAPLKKHQEHILSMAHLDKDTRVHS